MGTESENDMVIKSMKVILLSSVWLSSIGTDVDLRQLRVDILYMFVIHKDPRICLECKEEWKFVHMDLLMTVDLVGQIN